MKSLVPALCLVAACTSEANLGRTYNEVFAISPALPTPLDVLVVLDDTTAMASHLPRVPNPANLGGVLVGIYNGSPDVQIAVTTSTTGTLRTSPIVPTGVIVHKFDIESGSLVTNYQGDLATAIGSLMNVGTSSTAPNTIAASAASALDNTLVRDDSGVGILMVSASDDASSDDVTTYADAIYANGNRVLVSAVYDAPSPRIAQFVDAFAYRYTMDFASYNMEAISIFAQLFQHDTVDQCVPPAALAEGELTCQMSTSYHDNASALAECNGDVFQSEVPCWKLVDEVSCNSGKLILFGGPYRYYHPRVACSGP